MKRNSLAAALLIALVLTSVFVGAERAAGQTTAATTTPEPETGQAPETYRIGPEDLLQIAVWKNEAMTRTVPVRPDGKISLPLLNDVQAAGLTALELRKALTQKLSDFMPNPEVSVIVLEVRSFKVSVIGEITKPGRYELRSWATVVDVLALAGGFTQFASRSRIVVLRQEGTVIKRIPFNYNKLAGDQENFYLRNGDIVLVP